MQRWLDRFSIAALLLMPPFLMHGRGVADTLLSLVALAFLAGCVLRGEWRWLREDWVPWALAWWGWLVLCSVPGIGVGGWLSFGHALACLRFVVFVAALERRVLRHASPRRWLSWVLTASALYIGLSALLQFATGRDLVGWRRSGDGELTGPFQHPRAAAPLSRLLFPTLLPAIARLRRPAALALTVVSVGTLVLIGQRMPVLLTGFGLVVSGLLLRRLRAIVVAGLAAGALLVAASVVVSPPTWYRLVQKFSRQMENFPDSDYGRIGTRAAVIGWQHPVFGRGFAGYRDACGDPRTFVGWSTPDGYGGSVCNIHPHNHYLEALDDSGVPGLLLFSAMVFAWWRALLRGIGPDPDPLRVGLFVAALIQEWPIASASSFSAVEIAGFFFVMLGWGLAQARYDPRTAPMSPSAARPMM